MKECLRKSGIDIIGDVPWGTHFCQFYRTQGDLLDVLVPYFKAGLDNNEFCMWVTSHPLAEREAEDALRIAVPEFDRYRELGQIEIVAHTDWYLKGGFFDSRQVLSGWVEKHDISLKRGYSGLRLTGNTFWLEKAGWEEFLRYEDEVNNFIGKYRMMAVCTYSLDRCGASEIIDVVNTHQFALARRDGKWNLIESSGQKRAEEALRESERRERERAEELATLLEAVPTPVIIVHDPGATHMTGNRAADELLQHPRGSEVSLSAPPEVKPRHFRAMKDGRELRPDELPAQRAARGEHVQDFEFNLVFDDGTTRHLLGYGTPLLDRQGLPRGAVHVLVDISVRKRAEEALRASAAEKEILLKELAHRTKNNMQVIGSLLTLQAAASGDQKLLDALADTQDRIRAMALVHEKLYRTGNYASLNMKEYLGDLMTSLLRTHQGAVGPVTTDMDLEDVLISIDAALPCGLIINELVSNSLKHAFPDRKHGVIRLSLRRVGGKLELTYRDDGPGLPGDLELPGTGSLGLKLVYNLAVRQLRGTMKLRRDPVSEFVFTFEDLTHSERT